MDKLKKGLNLLFIFVLLFGVIGCKQGLTVEGNNVEPEDGILNSAGGDNLDLSDLELNEDNDDDVLSDLEDYLDFDF